MSESVANKLTTDEAALYDRQIRLWGLEAQNRLRVGSVLLIGLTGMGAETLKNIILSGLKSLTILDDKNVGPLDLRTNCLLDRRTALHKPRAESSVQRLQQLNPLVALKTYTVPTKQILETARKLIYDGPGFDLVCCVDRPVDESLRINAMCRECPQLPLFTMGGVCGWFGYVFNDFGQDFEYATEVKASYIAPPKEQSSTAVGGDGGGDDAGDLAVNLDDDEPEFKRPRLIERQVAGDGESGGGGVDTIPKTTDGSAVVVAELRSGSGDASKKEPEKKIVRKIVNFTPLEHTLTSPPVPDSGNLKRKRAGILHPMGYYLFQITAGFLHTYHRNPSASTKDVDTRALKREMDSVFGRLGEHKLYLPDKFEESLFDQNQAVCSIVGGVLGQEIIKGVSRFHDPIQNWFFYDPYDSSGQLAKIPRTK